MIVTKFCLKGKNCNADKVVETIVALGLHWLKDDIFASSENSNNNLLAVLLSNVLFVIENVVMILMFYFSQHSNSWFSLAVTVYVCMFSVVGSTMKVVVFYVFLR